jgi:hypothetical protein
MEEQQGAHAALKKYAAMLERGRKLVGAVRRE